MTMIAVLTTVDDRETARAIAQALVERRLAACVQISEIESHYRWEGAVQRDREYRVLCKTTTAGYEAAEAAILELHPYDLPAIFALEADRIHAPFARWIDGEVSVAGSVSPDTESPD